MLSEGEEDGIELVANEEEVRGCVAPERNFCREFYFLW